MQVHTFDFVVDGTPEEVWDVMWRRTRVGFTSDTVTIEILHPGDEEGNGLVRHCHFPVPRYLLSGGRAQSWEWITEARRPVSWRYDAVGKPLWSRASGGTRLEDLGGGRTRVHFRETYEVFNPRDAAAPRAPGAPLHLRGQRRAHRGLARPVTGCAARGAIRPGLKPGPPSGAAVASIDGSTECSDRRPRDAGRPAGDRVR